MKFEFSKTKIDGGVKLPKQASEIIAVISEHQVIDRDDLLKELKLRLKTVQPVERVLGFYKSLLISAGIKIKSCSAREESIEESMKEVASLTITADDGPLCLKVVRGFRVGTGLLLICGEDADDHDLWLVEGNNASLVGVLSAGQLKTALKARAVTLSRDDFEFVASDNFVWPLAGSHVGKLEIQKLSDLVKV